MAVGLVALAPVLAVMFFAQVYAMVADSPSTFATERIVADYWVIAASLWLALGVILAVSVLGYPFLRRVGRELRAAQRAIITSRNVGR